jgi:predicted GNAT family acetyltransferase
MSTIEVTHNAAASRFEATVDGLLCRADYQLVDGVMRMTHTEVPSQLAGRADKESWQVEPWCSYVRTYMQRHADTQRLLPPGFRL